MRRFELNFRHLLVMVAVLLGACAQQQPLVMRPPPAELVIIEPELKSPEVDFDAADPMADVPGDRLLPALAGKVERIDCLVGSEDLQARMAMEARGGHIASFAYYSKWRPYTCSMDLRRDDPAIKWRLAADGATRVQTPHGSFLIRVDADAFVFEFWDVERQKFCGMEGFTNGTMTIKRDTGKPECSVAGLLEREGLAREDLDAELQPVTYQRPAQR